MYNTAVDEPSPPAHPPPQHDAPMSGLKRYLAPKRADPNERPMIFASREYEDIYFAEYSDRIEVYRRRKDKMKLIDTFDKH